MQNREFNLKYVGIAYLIGLVYATPITFFLFKMKIDTDQFSTYIFAISLSFLLFPLAKFLFDNLGGFYILQRSEYSPSFWRAYVGLALVIFIFTILLAPIGLIFAATSLITRKRS